MSYQHRWIDGSAIDLPVGKVVCVGRNYAEHARELGNEVPDAPILFIKPASSLVPMAPSFNIPTDQGEVHHEIEMALLVSERLQNVDALTAQWSMAGFGLGLDLTLRDVQNELKKKGHPWERAKAFDGACPVSGFIDARGPASARQYHADAVPGFSTGGANEQGVHPGTGRHHSYRHTKWCRRVAAGGSAGCHLWQYAEGQHHRHSAGEY